MHVGVGVGIGVEKDKFLLVVTIIRANPDSDTNPDPDVHAGFETVFEDSSHMKDLFDFAGYRFIFGKRLE
jgi:hypothetical protein